MDLRFDLCAGAVLVGAGVFVAAAVCGGRDGGIFDGLCRNRDFSAAEITAILAADLGVFGSVDGVSGAVRHSDGLSDALRKLHILQHGLGSAVGIVVFAAGASLSERASGVYRCFDLCIERHDFELAAAVSGLAAEFPGFLTGRLEKFRRRVYLMRT